MKTNTQYWLKGSAVLIATLALISGCGGGGDDGPAPPITAVPDSASVSSASFIAFIQSLAMGDETSEPLTFSASFANPPEDNSGEPAPLL